MIPALDGAIALPAPAFSVPHIALTVKPSAPNMDALPGPIGQISATMDEPFCIAAVRMDEDGCCAELDVAARPVDPRRLH